MQRLWCLTGLLALIWAQSTYNFYSEAFDGCPNMVFSSNGQTGCGWRTQFLANNCYTDWLGTCCNHWCIDANEAGQTPPNCGSGGGSDKSLYMGATGGICALMCSGACYLADPSTLTDKRIYLNTNIDLTTGPLYPYDSIVVQFDLIGYGGDDVCGGPSDYGAFEYSVDGGVTWISPAVVPWVVAGGLQPWANTMNYLASNLCPGGQGRWTRVRWRVPAGAMTSTQFRIGFRWRNNADACGSDPSFAVDDIQVIGYKTVPLSSTALVVEGRWISPSVVELHWRWTGERGAVTQYRVYASKEGTLWAEVGQTVGTTFQHAAEPMGPLWYRVTACNQEGQEIESAVVRVVPPRLPLAVWPNPAVTEVFFAVPSGLLRVEIWDQLGRRVAALSGCGTLRWEVPPDLPRGLYFYQAEGPEGLASGRVAVHR